MGFRVVKVFVWVVSSLNYSACMIVLPARPNQSRTLSIGGQQMEQEKKNSQLHNLAECTQVLGLETSQGD